MSRRFALGTLPVDHSHDHLIPLFPGLPGAVQQAVIDPADTGWMLAAKALCSDRHPD